jgi:hypothetical protein
MAEGALAKGFVLIPLSFSAIVNWCLSTGGEVVGVVVGKRRRGRYALVGV